jgi:hypothetical protein
MDGTASVTAPPIDGRLIWGVAVVGGAGLLFLVLFGLWMFRHQEPRGNERLRSWTLYGQFLLATTLVVIIALLMIPRIISAEAGLAVLSAIGGFAAGRTIGPASRVRMRRRPGHGSGRREPLPRVRSASILPAPALHPESLGDSPPPLSSAEPIVTARYPRNRSGKP